MKWTYKQWLSTIPKMQLNEQSSLTLTNWTLTKTMTYDVGNSGPDLGQAHLCDRVKPNGVVSSQYKQYFSYVGCIGCIGCIGWWNRKTPLQIIQLHNVYRIMLHRVNLTMARIQITSFSVLGTDNVSRCKPILQHRYHICITTLTYNLWHISPPIFCRTKNVCHFTGQMCRLLVICVNWSNT